MRAVVLKLKPHRLEVEPEISWTYTPRIEPGEHPAFSRSSTVYRDRQFKRWVCAIQFDVLDGSLTQVVARLTWYLNLGSREKPHAGRRANYWAAWTKANGGPPRRHDRLSRRIFERRQAIALGLQWGQIDLLGRAITVGRAKTASGTGRVIPINDELAHVLAEHRTWFVGTFGEPLASHYAFPWGSPEPSDPSRHVIEVKRSWSELRTRAGVSCRLHDLRHTFATGLAERGVSESTMLALMGHMSRSMLERYSHIRMTAKRDAVAGITLRTAEVTGNSEVVPVKVPVVEPIGAIQ